MKYRSKVYSFLGQVRLSFWNTWMLQSTSYVYTVQLEMVMCYFSIGIMKNFENVLLTSSFVFFGR